MAPHVALVLARLCKHVDAPHSGLVVFSLHTRLLYYTLTQRLGTVCSGFTPHFFAPLAAFSPSSFLSINLLHQDAPNVISPVPS